MLGLRPACASAEGPPQSFLLVSGPIRAFIGDLRAEGSRRLMIAAIRQLAPGRDAEMLAGGVETPARLAALHELGCDPAQGLLLGRTMTPAALAKVFRSAGAAGRRVA